MTTNIVPISHYQHTLQKVYTTKITVGMEECEMVSVVSWAILPPDPTPFREKHREIKLSSEIVPKVKSWLTESEAKSSKDFFSNRAKSFLEDQLLVFFEGGHGLPY